MRPLKLKLNIIIIDAFKKMQKRDMYFRAKWSDHFYQMNANMTHIFVDKEVISHGIKRYQFDYCLFDILKT